jgi:hypothetical protein
MWFDEKSGSNSGCVESITSNPTRPIQRSKAGLSIKSSSQNKREKTLEYFNEVDAYAGVG